MFWQYVSRDESSLQQIVLASLKASAEIVANYYSLRFHCLSQVSAEFSLFSTKFCISIGP
jgi:hypothetical protein